MADQSKPSTENCPTPESTPKSTGSRTRSDFLKAQKIWAMKKRLTELLREKLRRAATRSLMAYVLWTFPRFEKSWHHDLIATWLEMLDGRAVIPGFPQGFDRLIITAPPRHTKSEIASVRRPAWSIGRDPTRQFMIGSYGDTLATTFSRGARNILAGSLSQQIFDVKFKTTGDTKWQVRRPPELDNEKDSVISGGVLGPFTGEGATDAIIDDPFKNQQDAYSRKIRDRVWEQYLTVFRTRLQRGGSICIQMTRWHDDDLVGRLLKAAAKDKGADQWVVIVLAAINDDGKQSYIFNTATGERTDLPAYRALWEAWFPRKDLNRIAVTQGPVFFRAMYQQAPIVAQGAIFKRAAWKYYQSLPVIERLVMSADTAFEEGQENDYSAMGLVGTTHNGFFVPDAWRDRVGFPELVRTVYDRWERCAQRFGRYPERLLIENKGSGISLAQQIEANNLVGQWIDPDGVVRDVPIIPVVRMPATESKVVRATGISGYQNAGLVMLPEGGWGPDAADLEDFLDELSVFDKGANDDQVDWFTHALTFYTRPIDGEEREDVVTFGDDVAITNELDAADLLGW